MPAAMLIADVDVGVNKLIPFPYEYEVKSILSAVTWMLLDVTCMSVAAEIERPTVLLSENEVPAAKEAKPYSSDAPVALNVIGPVVVSPAKFEVMISVIPVDVVVMVAELMLISPVAVIVAVPKSTWLPLVVPAFIVSVFDSVAVIPPGFVIDIPL
jgi:hypothetical protein